MRTSGYRTLIAIDDEQLPNDNPKDFYRVQILEREKFFFFGWERQWRSEFWNISQGLFGTRYGNSNWVSEWTVENTYGIKRPPIGSRYLFGYGPGTDDDGEIEVHFTGTAYWVY